jgi:2-iminobutanoate/2-iminopropanoate deaminase
LLSDVPAQPPGRDLTRRIISTGHPPGPYSPAVVAGQHCYVSGLGGFDPVTGESVAGGTAAETRVALDNAEKVLESAGYRMRDVVSVTCCLRHIDDWPTMNDVYATYFEQDPPARAAVAVDDLPAGAGVELSFIAWKEQA